MPKTARLTVSFAGAGLAVALLMSGRGGGSAADGSAEEPGSSQSGV